MIIKIFTIIGSCMGILSFFYNIFKFVSDQNKVLVEKILSNYTLKDLKYFKNGCEEHTIQSDDFHKVVNLKYFLKDEKITLNFKGLSKKNGYIDKIIKIIGNIETELYSEYWIKRGNEKFIFLFNKEKFEKLKERDKEMKKHLDKFYHELDNFILYYRKLIK